MSEGMTREETKVKTFDVLRFIADNAGLSIFEAIEKAYNMGLSEQEPKTGHWKYAEQLQAEICSCCGCIKGDYFFSDIEVPIKFCPNCGASMESEGAE